MSAPVLKPITGNFANAGLDWRTYPDPADGFNVYRKLSTDSAYQKVIDGVSTQNTHCGCSPTGATFNFYVTAVAGGVESAASNVENWTVPAAPPSR